MKCVNGHEMPETAKFCPECGAPRELTLEEKVTRLQGEVEALKKQLEKLALERRNPHKKQSLAQRFWRWWITH